MPHKPGHNRYKVVDTNREYTGRILQMGDELYSTNSGAFEGGYNGSKRLELMNGKKSQVVNRDTVTPFIVGANVGEQFYHPEYSRKKYYYTNGNEVPAGTELHHHTMPAPGDNNFMTQHNMDGAVNVLTVRPRGTNRRRTTNTTRTPRRTTRSTGGSQQQNSTAMNSGTPTRGRSGY